MLPFGFRFDGVGKMRQAVHSEYLAVRIPPALRAAARDKMMSKGEFVRAALRQFIKEREAARWTRLSTTAAKAQAVLIREAPGSGDYIRNIIGRDAGLRVCDRRPLVLSREPQADDSSASPNSKGNLALFRLPIRVSLDAVLPSCGEEASLLHSCDRPR